VAKQNGDTQRQKTASCVGWDYRTCPGLFWPVLSQHNQQRIAGSAARQHGGDVEADARRFAFKQQGGGGVRV